MAGMDEKITALSALFPPGDVEWKIQHVLKDGSNRGLVVPYIDSRAIQERLDQVLGPMNWRNDYRPWHQTAKGQEVNPSQLCGISVFCGERGEWITKWDGAENSDIEPIKGGISDSFKRAAVLWGIGRYLYGMDGLWIDVEPAGKSFKIPEKARKDLDAKYMAACGKLAQGGKPAPSGGKAPAAPSAPANPPRQQTPPSDFDYTVKEATATRFGSSTGMILVLHDMRTGQDVQALTQDERPDIAPGSCLKNVRLTQRESGGTRYNTLDGYEVA